MFPLRRCVMVIAVIAGLALFISIEARAQGRGGKAAEPPVRSRAAVLTESKDKPGEEGGEDASLAELRLLRAELGRLQARVDELEARLRSGAARPREAISPPPVAAAPASQVADPRRADLFRDATINVTLDGYYGYNFNRPAGGINLLRAYDVLSNSFSLNQAAVVIEQAPNPEAGRRFGMRLDLQYGQATETVQGNAANEPRPQVYRNLWQAYGTYVAPIGRGLTLDFGKFAGALGYETNYTKDNFNYSRSYFFNYLPFYHFGLRAIYPVNEKLTAAYWLVNGANQSEDVNGGKSQAILLAYKPTRRIALQTNYYAGREQRDRAPALNPTFAPLPTQPGLSMDLSQPELRGRFHDFPPPAWSHMAELPRVKLMPTYHPAYLLRTPEEKGKAWEDLKEVMRLLAIPIPGSQA